MNDILFPAVTATTGFVIANAFTTNHWICAAAAAGTYLACEVIRELVGRR